MRNLQFKLSGKIYGRSVWMNDKKLSPAKSHKINNHSPDGFNWGYAGSGPAQLALAIMLELYPNEKALSFYQEFKQKVIAPLPQSDFEIFVVISGKSLHVKKIFPKVTSE